MSDDQLAQHTPLQGGSIRVLTSSSQDQPQREMQKNYVFVDEHNRHKRLKVMRACEGCRRRKIKCDAATTNSWPCSACIRLKLRCVRPNSYDDFSSSLQSAANDSSQSQGGSSQSSMALASTESSPGAYTLPTSYSDPESSSFLAMPLYSSQPQPNIHYTAIQPPVPAADLQQYTPPKIVSNSSLGQASRAGSSLENRSIESCQQQDLADLLGTLKVNEVGTAPYLRNQDSFRHQELPAIEDDDGFGNNLPSIPASPGSKIQIPPELMPSDDRALQYLELYFTHVHPYVPVLNRLQFYRQWHLARESISPLILEALFAIGGRLADDPAQGQQWLALASRHADSFMDVPRLSTLQALLIILKAREAAPKRGYYYRSWMMVVQCVQMGKDLGLDEHYDEHQAGRSCQWALAECQLRTRIWQTVFVCEVMVGTPQGRHDLSVNMESVDFNIPASLPEEKDDCEYHVSLNFTYFTRLVRTIGRMSQVYARMKRKKDWGISPEFQVIRQDIGSYLTALPADMTVSFPSDGSPPWLPSSFVGNLHSYYYLTLILYHRPVLSFLNPDANESEWKHHMLACCSSARALCRLQEAVLSYFGLTGLQNMQRGFSFTVYAGLSCIVIHLVAIVSPDPELNSDAREYFTRHMRLVETVMGAWMMVDLHKQINAIREAFSADVSKPFVLKSTFPYGSPPPSNDSSPSQASKSHGSARDQRESIRQQLEAAVSPKAKQPNRSLSPPPSADHGEGIQDSPSGHPSFVISPEGRFCSLQQGVNLPANQSTWNPARIFEQWNASFGRPVPSQSLSSGAQANSLNNASASGTAEGSVIQEMGSAIAPDEAQMPSQQYIVSDSLPTFITPAMWQESVASVYEGGLRRTW